MINVTLDTGCFNIKKNTDLDSIFSLAEQGKITIAFADATIYDILNGHLKIDDLRKEEREPAGRRIEKAEKFRRLPSWQTFKNHYNRFPLVFANLELNEKVADILFPDRKRGGKFEEEDIRQIIAHLNSGNDVFITFNKKDFINDGRKEKLLELGIKVQTPKEFLLELKNND